MRSSKNILVPYFSASAGIEKSIEFIWTWGSEDAALAAIVAGDGDFERSGMEEEASFWRWVVAIDWVAKNRVTEVFEVDTKLVGAASDGFKFDKRIGFAVFLEDLLDFVVGLRRFAAGIDHKSGWAF